MFDPSQADVRKFFCDLWRKHTNAMPLTPLEATALDWIIEHPEYHNDLADVTQALAKDYSVEAGRTNPFLHLSMHLAISEQLSINQPPGIKPAFEKLAQKKNSIHAAAHIIMECLGDVVWQSQRSGLPPDGAAYLQCIERNARDLG
jgi:Domain of unknown function (DUF1841)